MPHREIGVVWHFWAVCLLVVAVGAPLGAYVISKVPPSFIMIALLLLIAVEIMSTLLLVAFTPPRLVFVFAILLAAGGMPWRHHRFDHTLTYLP